MSSASQRKLAANRENARRSTGPKTPQGKAKVKFNALKHGLLAREVVIPVGEGKENRAEFDHLVFQLCEHYSPVGPVEELLVEKIAVAYWRLRRAVRCEVGEIRAELADEDEQESEAVSLKERADRVRELLEELEDDSNPTFDASLCEELEWDFEAAHAELEKIEPGARKKQILTWLEDERTELLERAREEELKAKTDLDMARARGSLPDHSTVEKILRYETTIERQLYRAITELEKLQRDRRRALAPSNGQPVKEPGVPVQGAAFLPNKATVN